MEMKRSAINFIFWFTKNTTSIQGNVRRYKNKMYFMDRERETGRDTDGGLLDLWEIYVKEMIG